MNINLQYPLLCFTICCLCIVSGCSSEPKLYPVSGSATANGKPIPEGTVTFYDSKNEVVSSGMIEGGKYTANVPAGEFKVVVTPPIVELSDPEKGISTSMKNMKEIAEKYRSVDGTDLSIKVDANTKTYDIVLNFNDA